MQPTMVFDLGNVLIGWDIYALYRKLLDSDEEIAAFLNSVRVHEWNAQMDAGKPFAEAVEELSVEHPDKAHLIRAYHERWIETILGPIDGTVRLLEQLDERGYRLLALSNWSAETFPLIRHTDPYSFLDRFETIFLSGQLRMIKPHEPIFRHLLEKSGCRAEECFFIDDSKANIETADRLGFQTHLFHAPEALENDLRARGILSA
ncbi:MAG: HAD family phosphatase [Geminicoccaceae bacterium]|nr:HAD family phosphatase [Geminicoccaceae bacterium]MCB2012731.1 HAD family phosphatase [Geminicoccaceae bacterium]